jgi:hypothetical protein
MMVDIRAVEFMSVKFTSRDNSDNGRIYHIVK